MILPGVTPSLKPYDRDTAHAGMYAPTCFFLPYTSALTASFAYLARFVPSRPMVIVSIGFNVSTAAGANDNVDVGIYNASLSRLGSSGATASKLNSTGAKTVTLSASVALTPGQVYYAALAPGTFGGSAAVLSFADMSCNAGSSSSSVELFGSGAPNSEGLYKSASHPLPSSISTPSVGAIVPILALRET